MILYTLLACLATPVVAAITIFFLAHENEKRTSHIATVAGILYPLLAGASIALWAYGGFETQRMMLGELYRSGDYAFTLSLILDLNAAVFLGVTALLSGIIVKYCRYYLHREAGYSRFFVTIYLFVFGMTLLETAGTLDLLFAGWEIVGIASFLLIAFYRDRPMPVRNALRAYGVYRLCDIGLLLGAWLTHGEPGVALSLLILLAASGKSAQFPFCAWLPRAMEGPTPSSAIFYGALSIHAGVFLLLRTHTIWNVTIVGPICVGAVGAITAAVAGLCGRTQSNIKGQVGYASIVQVGLMLVELALGLHNLALFHFAANAFFRCYQLLVSPSAVAHLLRVQSAAGPNAQISDWSIERMFPQRWRSTFYVLSLQEGYLERLTRFSFLSLTAKPWIVWTAGLCVNLAAAGTVFAVEPEAGSDVLVFLSGVVPAFLVGLVALLNPRRARLALFLAFLGMSGFPITPAFIGEDLLLHHAAGNHLWLAGAIAFAFVLNGIMLMNLYARLCMGPSEGYGSNVRSFEPHRDPRAPVRQAASGS